MTVTELLEQLNVLGIRLSVDVADIRLRGTGQELNPVLLQEIAHRKADIIREVAPPVFIDLETRSACDISLGGRKYSQHPTTEILSCVIWIDGRLIVWLPRSAPNDSTAAVALAAASAKVSEFGVHPVSIQVFVGAEVPQVITDAANIGRIFCAHNAHGFDALVWDAKRLPAPGAWVDTLPLARLSGWPGSLDKIAQLIQVGQKDPDGGQLIKRINSDCQRGVTYALTHDELATLIRYNVQDVLLLLTMYPYLTPNTEPEVIEVDRIINARGIKFDVCLASALVELDRRHRDHTVTRLAALTHGEVTESDLNRVTYLRGWLARREICLPNLRRTTVELFLSQANDQVQRFSPEAVAVLEARRATSQNSSKRLVKALGLMHPDGRLRDGLVYHKAHTGRWAGSGFQPHNLPNPHPALGDSSNLIRVVHDFDAFQGSLPSGVDTPDAISSLIRPCLIPASGHVFCIADFASIEARGLAWCAGDTDLLAGFERGVDVYCDLASQIFPYSVRREQKREREIGKLAVLGCGYGMSAGRFGEMAVGCGIDLSAAGVTADQVVERYRDTYPAIAGRKVCDGGRVFRVGGIWKDVEQAARNAITSGVVCAAGRCRFEAVAGNLCVTLPGGRTMYYRNARLEYSNEDYRSSIVYDLPDRPREYTYGGKLVENIVQAICRDLLASALVRCERAGLPVVLHVHDEIIIEVPASQADPSLQLMLQIMSTPPNWATGFPIDVEGFVAPRYFKSPVDGAQTVTFRNGQFVR